MTIVCFDFSLIAIFLIFALGLVYQGYLALRGVFAIAGIVLFILFAAAAAYFVFEKVRQSMAKKTVRSVWNLFLALSATGLCLYQGFLTLTQIGVPGDGPIEMIFFLFGLVLSVGMFLATAGCWAGAVTEDGFGYKSFFQELLSFGFFYFLVFYLPQTV